MPDACGIDFGTSNSTAARYTANGPQLLPLEDGKPTLPSAVFFNLDEDSMAFGRAALSEYLEGFEGRLMRAMKSLLGSSLIDQGTEVAGRQLSFKSLIGCFIGEVKRRAESAAGQSFGAVVLGRPVRFVDDNDEADRLAEQTLATIAREQGFAEVSFQFEPIAAAHAYEQDISGEELTLVVDIGGGTSDFSLVRLSPQRRGLADRSSDLLASSGVHVGGTDLDKRLSLAAIMPELGLGAQLANGALFPSTVFFQLATWHTINFAYGRKSWRSLQELAPDVTDTLRFQRLLNVVRQQTAHHLAMRVEDAKIALSATAAVNLPLPEIDDALQLALQRGTFEAAIADELAAITRAADAALLQAGVHPDGIDTLFFTGGASAVPALRATLAARFPAARAVEGDAYGSVGAGLAVVASQRYG